MKIAVVENEPGERLQLCSWITGYFGERAVPVRLKCYGDGKEIVEAARDGFDVIFMDIQMDGLDGLEAARQIRVYDSQVMIVFITNMAGHAIDGYSVQALDFLVKPVSARRLHQELDKLLELYTRQKPQKIALKTNGGIYQMEAGDIFYIELYGRKIRVHSRQGILETGGALKHFEELLGSAPFFRCHQAFLVNMAHVSSVEKYDVTVNGTRIPVSRQKKKPFIQAFAAYLGGAL